MADPVGDILAASLAAPDDTALDVMRLSLLDWIAVGYAGREEPVARIVREMVLAEGGAERAALFGGGRAPARGAALVNGAASHALDYDDTHFAHIGHPSVAVIPAALAVAEAAGEATVGHLLGAALAGCEASIRFGLLFGRGHYQTGFHQTATAGAFGATLAAALQLSPDATVMAHALGLTATRASGVKAQFGTMGKPYNAGIAAANGVECATLAARGFLANPEAITGPLGFLATHHCDGDAVQPGGFLMRDVSHKFHACCHGLHAALEAVASLGPQETGGLERITVETHPRWIGVCDKPAPVTGLEAKFSYAAVLALSLSGRDTGALDTYRDALLRDPDLRDLMARVEVLASGDLSETQARVTIIRADRQERVVGFDLSAPQSLETRIARVRDKSATLLGAARAEALWKVVQTPDAPVSALTAFIA